MIWLLIALAAFVTGVFSVFGLVVFEPRDLWIGVYWKSETTLLIGSTQYRTLKVYICLLPMFPIVLKFKFTRH